MSLRSIALLIPFVLTLVVGAWILFEPGQASLPGDLKRTGIPESMGKQLSGKTSQVPQGVLNKILILSKNKELLLYGSIAVFGILIMGVAIAGAKSTPKDKTTSALEVLKQEKEKAEHIAKLKSEFLNQVSHELRTPLAVIIGYIECITDGLYGEIEAKHQEILQIVAKQSSHLKNMIDQILIFSRLEANKQPLRIEDFQVSKVFNDLRDTFDFLCKQKGLEIRWELSKEVDTLRTDPERLKELVSNLLQNAVKYTDRGVISVCLDRMNSNAVRLDVSDTGIGIAHHHLSHIFDPFMQVHKTSSENSRGGIGLGLSIVKKHVDQLKGTVTVESELGKGTTFKILLPRLYEGRSLSSHRLRTLIKLPIPLTGVKSTSRELNEPTKINQAVG
jgi:signal transduction histidine kinase